MALQILASMDLTQDQQQIITKVGDSKAKEKLAKASKTTQKIINTLALDENESVYKPALARCNDLKILNKFFQKALRKSKTDTLNSLARNPNLPQEHLVALLDYPDSDTKLRAYINPSIDTNIKVSKLTPQVAQEVTQTTGEFVEHMVRAYELVLANLFLSDSSNYYGVNISLALQLVGRKKSRWNSESIEKLMNHGGIYSDLELLTRQEMDYEKAVFLVSNKRDKQVEPSVLSKIVNKYGSNILAHGQQLDKGYLNASKWVNLGLESYTFLAGIDKSYLDIPDILGNNLDSWYNFKMLESSWAGDLVSMAKAAVNL